MNGPTLFDSAREAELEAKVIEFTAHARRTDPGTSHAAAKSVRNQTDTHERILELFERFGDATDEDLLIYWEQCASLFDWPTISPSGLRSRRAELVALGLVVDTGRKDKTSTGRACIVWDRASEVL